LASDGAEESLGRCYASEVDQRQGCRQRTVDEGVVYEEVYLVEPVAKDRYPHGDGYAHYADYQRYEADPF
jgi:hypothetical protein